MSDAPEGKIYMGMAWNKPTSKRVLMLQIIPGHN